MGVIEQVSRYDDHVNEVRMTRMKHFAERSERAIRRWQRDGLVDRDINPTIAADALGAMVGRFSELWLVQGYREYDFDDAVEQLTALWANALRLKD
jgi:AcrR family transcriptional regulator